MTRTTAATIREFFRSEPLYHYPMDRFSIKSPILYRPEHRVVHVGGGPNRNHPLEINLNQFRLENVDIVGDAEHLPLGNASVDVVVSNAVLEHVKDLKETLREIDRVLKPGGLVYIEIPFAQHYHTHDAYGVRFEDYRRLTKAGLAAAFDFCTPLDVGVCVGPTSALFQIVFSFLRDLSPRPLYRRVVDFLYRLIGNPCVQLDAHLSEAVIERSVIPSGIYYFGRKRDGKTLRLDELPQPNSQFPRDAAARIVLGQRTAKHLDVHILNTGQTTWLRAAELGWGTVRVGLQRVTENRVERDFKRLDLPRDIGPGERCEMRIDLGEFEHADAIKVDLVIEGIAWFEDRGSRPLSVRLRER